MLKWRCLILIFIVGMLIACTPADSDLEEPRSEDVTLLSEEDQATPSLSQSAFAPQVVVETDPTNTPDMTPDVVALPTETPTPTNTPTPTDTPTPTPTDTPTNTPTNTPTPTETPTLTPEPAQRLAVEILAEYPHDTTVFSQGLHYESGIFFESGGLYKESSIRIVNLTDGEANLVVDLPDEVFGEGLAKVGDQIIQLTWRAGIAYIWNATDLSPVGEYLYEGEGWGLCYDDEYLWMSDGTAFIQRRDAATFELLESIEVTLDGEPLVRLNELECAEGVVYSNVWFTDEVVRIDKATGKVTAVIDASALLTAEERELLGSNDVLNGIAYNPEDEIYYLTGKRWPKLFAVEFVEVTE